MIDGWKVGWGRHDAASAALLDAAAHPRLRDRATDLPQGARGRAASLARLQLGVCLRCARVSGHPGVPGGHVDGRLRPDGRRLHHLGCDRSRSDEGVAGARPPGTRVDRHRDRSGRRGNGLLASAWVDPRGRRSRPSREDSLSLRPWAPEHRSVHRSRLSVSDLPHQLPSCDLRDRLPDARRRSAPLLVRFAARGEVDDRIGNGLSGMGGGRRSVGPLGGGGHGAGRSRTGVLLDLSQSAGAVVPRSALRRGVDPRTFGEPR